MGSRVNSQVKCHAQSTHDKNDLAYLALHVRHAPAVCGDRRSATLRAGVYRRGAVDVFLVRWAPKAAPRKLEEDMVGLFTYAATRSAALRLCQALHRRARTTTAPARVCSSSICKP